MFQIKAFWKKGKKKDEEGASQRPIPEDALFIHYLFRFEDETEQEIKIYLDPVTLQYLPQHPLTGDEWTRLGHHQCEGCPLDAEHHPNCPLALSVEGLVNVFLEKFSYETAEITVQTNERTYFKDTTMQKGLSSILGLLMVSSGCPVMDKLRPMVRLHLPFASVLETTFRTTSTYLLGQFFLQKKARPLILPLKVSSKYTNTSTWSIMEWPKKSDQWPVKTPASTPLSTLISSPRTYL